MTEKINENLAKSAGEFYCDFCKLDFTTKEELREHSWTILHHSKLNKAKGRDCIHECSLCNETFFELLLYTQHLHADLHQDRYQEWKTGQRPNHWLSKEPLSVESQGSSCTLDDLDTQLNPVKGRMFGRKRDQNHRNAVSNRTEERLNSRSRNRNRKQRHSTRDEVPFQFNWFLDDCSEVMSNPNGSCEMNINRNERDSNVYNFRNNRNNSSSIFDNSTNERPRSWNNYRSNSRNGHENHTKKNRPARKPRQCNQWRRTRRQSRCSSGSFDNSLESSDRVQEPKASEDRPRSTTPTKGVSTRTCSSESLDFPAGNVESCSNDRYASNSQLFRENRSGNRKWNLRNRYSFVWESESYRATRSGKMYLTNPQESQGKEKISSGKLKKYPEIFEGSGSNHANVGYGADERGGCPSTETSGHDNGNPEDSNTEVIYKVPLVNQSQEESSEKVFVSKRRIHSSNANGNPKISEMTMDEESSGSTTLFASESHSVNQSSENESVPNVRKTTNDSKTSSRLRARSSSDDTVLLSRQTFDNLANKVTQYQPLDKRALAGAALELTSNSNDSGLNCKEANPKEISNQSESEERSNIVTKIKKEPCDDNEKDIQTSTTSKIRQQNQQKESQGEKNTAIVPQCSFVHIDGVRCVAKTSDRYCSYHRRFPQGNLVKCEPQEEQLSTISLDLSTTVVTQEPLDSPKLNEEMSTRPRDAYSRSSDSARHSRDTPDHGKDSRDTNLEMMDLSMSTNYLVLPHSRGGTPTNPTLPISSSPSIYPGMWSKNHRNRDMQEILNPGPWNRNRTSPNVTHVPVTSSRNNQETSFSPDKEESKSNRKSDSSASATRKSPMNSQEGIVSSSVTSVPTLDLSRLNLPPNVRRALALKYATKKQGEGVTTITTVAPNLTTSRNRFIESKKESSPVKGVSEATLEQPSVVPYKSPTTPLRIRSRQQRSISLDSYPSSMRPVGGLYERSGLGNNSHEPFPPSVYDPLRTRSPLHPSGSGFPVPFSKQATYPEKPRMIDLNSAAYLPTMQPQITMLQFKEKELPPAERHGMGEAGHADKEKPKLNVPSLRTRMRTMSTERDSAYYKVDPPITKAAVYGTRTERRPSLTERDRYVVLDSVSFPVTSTLIGMHSQPRKDETHVPAAKLREAIDFKEGAGLRALESRTQPFPEMPLEARDPKERDATAVALDSHFRQSLNPFEHNVGVSKLREHGFVELGSSSVNLNKKIVAPKENPALSTRTALPHYLRKEVNRGASSESVSGDSGDNFEWDSSKRKATDLPESQHLYKKRRGLENTVTSNKPVSYLPGFEVQELLRLEHDEQNKIKSLKEVQEQIKEKRLKIQSLNVELEDLKAKENEISKDISFTKNKRVEILQFALRRSSSPGGDSCGSGNGSGLKNSATAVDNSSSLYTNASSEGGHQTTSVSTNCLPSTTSAITHTNVEIASSGSVKENGSTVKNTVPKNLENPVSPSSQSELKEKNNVNADQQVLSQTFSRLDPAVKVKMEIDYESQPRENHFSSVEVAKTSHEIPTIAASSVSENSDRRYNVHTNDALVTNTFEIPQHQTVESNNATSIPSTITSASDPGTESTGVEAPIDKRNWMSEDFKKSRKEFLHKIRHELSTPKKRQQAKKQRKKFSEAQISSSIAVSREKILLVREKMKGWKVQQEGNGMESNDLNCGTSVGGLTTNIPQDTDIPSTSVVYKDNALTPSKIPVRDTTNDPIEPTTNNYDKPVNKSDTKGKTKLRVVSKKSHSHSNKGQLKKKRKSTNPSKKIVHLGSSDSKKIENQSENGSEKSKDIITDELNIGTESHKVAVESLKQKLQKSNSGSKSLSTSKAKASSFEGHTGAVCSLKVYQGRLYTSSADKTTKAFDIQTGKCVKEYQGHHHAVNCLEILQDGDRLFTGSNDQTVRSYNIKTGICTHKFTFDGRVMCLHIGFGFLYVGLSTGIVTIVDLTSNTCVERLQCHEPRAVSCLATASEGQRSLLCTGSFDATISIRDYKSGLLIKTLKSHTMTVLCMQVVENVLYSGAADCKVLAHNLNTGELLRSYNGHTLSVSSLQVVGRVLISSCLDKLIRCYDLMSAELLQAYGGQTDMVFSVHVSNGRIYSGGRDGRVTSVKLDLRVFHPCKWKDCQLNFGVALHMKDHLRENHVIQQGMIDRCLWADCGQVFAESDGINTIMDHVLGHVDTKESSKH